MKTEHGEYCDGCGKEREEPYSMGEVRLMGESLFSTRCIQSPWVSYPREGTIYCPDCRHKKTHCSGCGREWKGEHYVRVEPEMETMDQMVFVPWLYLPRHKNFICPDCAIHGSPEKEEQPKEEQPMNKLRTLDKEDMKSLYRKVRDNNIIDPTSREYCYQFIREVLGEGGYMQVLEEVKREDTYVTGIQWTSHHPPKGPTSDELRDKFEDTFAYLDNDRIRVIPGYDPVVHRCNNGGTEIMFHRVKKKRP